MIVMIMVTFLLELPMSSRFAGDIRSPTEKAERLYSPPSLTWEQVNAGDQRCPQAMAGECR